MWQWSDDSGSRCTELYSFQCVFPHTLSSALTPAVLCLPCGLFREQTEAAVECRADTSSYDWDPRFIDEDTKVLGCAQNYRQ